MGGEGCRERTRSGYGCNELWVKAGSMSQSCCRDGVIEQQVSDLELRRSLPDRENVVGGWGGGCNQERRTSAALILMPGQRQETGSCRGYR